jgi:hypothetical protein
MDIAVDRPDALLSSGGASPRTGRDRRSLVRAAVARRRAERAFEQYVREMARRWQLGPEDDGSGADGGPLPRA